MTIAIENPHYGRRKIPRKVNLDWLYRKYRGICWICRKHVSRDQASRDHILPESLGGSSNKENIALAHKDCNSKRGNGYREVYFSHFENMIGVKEIRILNEHNLIVQVWQDRRNGGVNVLVAKKFKEIY